MEAILWCILNPIVYPESNNKQINLMIELSNKRFQSSRNINISTVHGDSHMNHGMRIKSTWKLKRALNKRSVSLQTSLTFIGLVKSCTDGFEKEREKNKRKYRPYIIHTHTHTHILIHSHAKASFLSPIHLYYSTIQ